jgi:phage terminase Nu1 subunit (DNA packaging protein)
MTYREAASAVRRSVRTIKRWRRSGMPMTWDLRHGQKVRVVDEDVLFAWLRDRLDAWPSHQYRLRRLQAAAATQRPDG